MRPPKPCPHPEQHTTGSGDVHSGPAVLTEHRALGMDTVSLLYQVCERLRAAGLSVSSLIAHHLFQPRALVRFVILA